MPALYMLDPNSVSHLLRGSRAVQVRLTAVSMAQVCISAVTEGELCFGVAKRPDRPKLRATVHDFLLHVDVLPRDSAAAQTYGERRADLERAGTPLGNLDMLIAAHAAAVGAVLVTNDRTFGQVAGLQIEDWSV